MRKLSLFLLIVLFSTLLSAQTETFIRKHVLPPPANEPGGWGNLVTNVDVDGDGKIDMFVVNENVNDTPDELIPRIYKYEWNGTSWDSVWAAVLDLPGQNTWPALIVEDWDNDGKKEVIWGPVNNFMSGASPNPARIIVFESKGDGSDVMGVAIPGTNNYRPNAKYTLTETASLEIRPFRWHMANVDGDAAKELVFCDRQSNYRFGIVSVSTIPDNGDGSEVWTLEKSGLGLTVFSGTYYDVAVLGTSIYLFSTNGSVVKVKWNGTEYVVSPAQALLPQGAWKTSCVADIDNNSVKEIVIAGGGASANQKVWLLRESGDTLVATEIGDFSTLVGVNGRMFGGDVGDIDADGKLDFVFGTRGASPNAAIVRLSYLGGDILLPASYSTQLLDKQIVPADGRFDIIGLANIDGVNGQEIMYSSGYGDPIPIVTLKRYLIETIAAVRVDANMDYQPDRLNQFATVKAVVNGVNLTASANRFQYTIQDETGGIVITKGSETGGGIVYNVGDELVATGKITQYRGTVQLELTAMTDVFKTTSGNVLTPISTNIPNYVANGYAYQSRLLEIDMLFKDPAVTVIWPLTNTDANFGVWDGVNKLILRLDRDTDIDGQPEPVWPIRVKGVATQFTTSATVYNDGWQITPMFYADITPNVPVELTSFEGKVVSGSVLLNWATATETNNRGFEIQRKTANSNYLTIAFINGMGSTAQAQNYSYTDQQISNELYTYRLKQIDYNGAYSYSKPIEVDVTAPFTYSLDQNYPNPFNPSTSIKFGLPVETTVDLRVFDILGNEVANLINNEMMTAGSHIVNFNAANLSTGTYFYRLSTSDFTSVKKMQLIK
ncbi:MAG: FG-GAP-like repeat-containing protein [Ignavibacteriaceae bacterium]